MKKLFLLLAAVLFANMIFAQSNQYSTKDVVYLKNGSIIKGSVIEQVPNETIKIMTTDGSIFVYRAEEVIKITKETSNYRGYRGYGYQRDNQRSGNSPYENDYYQRRTRRYYGAVDYTAYAQFPTYGITMVNGIRASETFASGFGFGIFDGSNAGDANDYSGVSLFYHMKYNFNTRPVSPYFITNTGGLFLDGYSGLFVEPGFGLSFRLTDRTSINTSVGLCFGSMYTESRYYYDSFYETYKYSYDNRRLSSFTFRIGIAF